MNLAAVVDAHPADAVAIISRRRTTTYGALRDQAAHLRGGLAALGLEPGDRVAIVCGNNRHFVASYLAILGAGLVAAPLNPSSPAPELARELEAVGVRAAVVGPTGARAFSRIDRSTVPSLDHVIATDPSGVVDGAAFDDLLAADPIDVVDWAADDIAVLLFTAGTAGSPKPAKLTHANLRSNIDQVLAHPARLQRPDDLAFGVLPLFHIYGLNVVLGASLAAGAGVLLVERFDPTSALASLARHGVTIVSGAPTMYTAWAALPDASADAFRGVRLAVSGAARLPLEVFDTFRQRYGLTIHEGYGLTEASPAVTTSAGHDVRPGSIGVPLPGVEVRLVDADGDDALVGDTGEIWVRGANVFAGYWGDDDATANALTPDGWLRTGDLAVVDDDGYLYLVDRAKDLIVVSGFNVYPGEVEEVLLEHPAVESAAVVGGPHPYSGEAVTAYAVARPGASVEEDEVIGFCAERLARYKCPDKVLFVDDLPRGLAGKVLRRDLRETPRPPQLA
ncbi:MAG: AMP-binding protein [Acidimicrobiales bacterium]